MCLLLWGMLLMECHGQLGAPPVITVQPLDQIVTNGGTAKFTVTVGANVTPVSYQWKFGTNDIPGTSGTIVISLTPTPLSYSISNVDSGDVGSYCVRLTNTGGTRSSSNGVLSTISVPLQFMLAQPATNGFKVRVTGVTASHYIIEASSNLLTWVAISTNSATSGIVDYTDPAGTNQSIRFYRARIQ
jgi:hypothetical protein